MHGVLKHFKYTRKLCYGNIAVMSTGVKYTMIYTLLQLVNLIIERRFNALPWSFCYGGVPCTCRERDKALISISHDAGRKRKKGIKSAGFPGVWKRWTWFRNQRDPLSRLFALHVTLIVKSQVAITNTSSHFSLYHRLLHFTLNGVYCYIHANMQVFHQWTRLWVFLFQVRL